MSGEEKACADKVGSMRTEDLEAFARVGSRLTLVAICACAERIPANDAVIIEALRAAIAEVATWGHRNGVFGES